MEEPPDFLDELMAERTKANPEFPKMVATAKIRRILMDTLTPRGVEQWLEAPNRLLGGKRPVDLIARGEADRVRAAAHSFVDGSYT